MPFYLGDLTEKIVSEDRIQCLKLSQGRLKVGLEIDKNSICLMAVGHCFFDLHFQCKVELVIWWPIFTGVRDYL